MRIPKNKSAPLWLLGLILPAVAAALMRNLAGKGYEAVRHRQPPLNPASRDVEWLDALLWTVMVGALGGIARLVVRRALAPTPLHAQGQDEKISLDLPFLD